MLVHSFFMKKPEKGLEAQNAFIQHCNDMLHQLQPTSIVMLDQLVWKLPFSHKNYKGSMALLDFSAFESEELMFVDKIQVSLQEGVIVELSPIGFAKWLLLELNKGMSIDYRIVWYLDRLKMLFAFLKEKEITILREEDLEEYFTLLLTHDFAGNNFVRRYSIPAYGSRFKRLDFMLIYRTLMSHNIDLLLEKFDNHELNVSLNNACIAQANLTLNDYKRGGTFDFLGLDVGRHYVDYCASFFEDNIAYATAASKTIKAITTEIDEEYKFSDDFRKKLIEELTSVLVGNVKYNLDDLDIDVKLHKFTKPIQCVNSSFPDEMKQYIRKKSLHIFCDFYNAIVVSGKAFTLDIINSIADELKLPTTRFDTQEFIRAMLFSRFYDSSLRNRNSICEEYKASIKKSSIFDTDIINLNWDVSCFDRICDKKFKEPKITIDEVSITCEEAILRLKPHNHNFNSLNTAIKNVESSGVTCFVAYTGWRASEFGFPLSSISAAINQDILDSNYTPFRFYVNWISPKTNGETLLEREVTLSTNILLQQLAQLNCSNYDYPALVSKKFSNTTELGKIISDHVARHWLDFPYKYKVFQEIDELQRLENEKSKLNELEKERLINLKIKYDINNSYVVELINLKEKLRKDSKIRTLAQRSYTGKNGSTVRFAETLRRYRNCALNKADQDLLNSILTQETQKAVLDEHFSFQIEAVAAVREEFVRDTHNATPHAFRHIWAEAVLRRYKGDIGKFIRANFKHIDERFFMAYLRNKETKAIYEVATRTTINSVVRKHVKSMGDEKRAYAGGFDRYLSKAISITNVVTQQEHDELANTIANNRVIDMKANPCVTCLLRANSKHMAKCSVDGVPQPHNAEPRLCMGCVNGDIEKGNYIGIVIYIKPDIDACRNPNIPFSWKKPHIETVNKALKRVRELRDNEGSSHYDKFIHHIEECLDIAYKLKEN